MPSVRKMSAVRRGGPEVLDLRSGPPPEPMAGEVRIAVEAAGVKLADVLWQRGAMPDAPSPPFTPGYDVVGRIDAVAGGVETVEVGDRVAALVGHGGYSESVLVAADRVVPVPEPVDAGKAAAVVTSYLSAYQVLVRIARVEAGDLALIHGAAGGTGSALLDVGRVLSLEMYGSAAFGKHDLVRGMGGRPIDEAGDFVEAVRSLAGGGVDLVVDPIGGRHLARSWKTLRRGGTLVATAMLAALDGMKRPEAVRSAIGIPLWNLLPNGRRARWYDPVAYSRRHLADYRADLAQLFRWLEQGRIRPAVAMELPLERAAEAQRMLLDREVAGKVVLRMDGTGGSAAGRR